MKEALSSEELSKMCFAPEDASSFKVDHKSTGKASSEDNRDMSPTPPFPSALQFPPKRMTSRTGRENQRWATDPQTNQRIRLTTGCVPIMSDGRILFCSSSRKQEWILPKGGWEADETMEESALRETFEEAGVIGVLGPRLAEVEYETRKAKKRRLEREDMMKKVKQEAERRTCEILRQSTLPPTQPSSSVVSVHSHSSCGASSEDEHHSYPTVPGARNIACSPSAPGVDISSQEKRKDETAGSDGGMSPGGFVAPNNAAAFFPPRPPGYELALAHFDDTASITSVASVASDASTTCTHVRMTLFPLYVSDVKNEWPESGRARKVMDIEAGIKMMENRPEFRKALVEIKQRGLHLVGSKSDPKSDASSRNEGKGPLHAGVVADVVR